MIIITLATCFYKSISNYFEAEKKIQPEIPKMKLKSRRQGKEKLKKHNDKWIYINMIYYFT